MIKTMVRGFAWCVGLGALAAMGVTIGHAVPVAAPTPTPTPTSATAAPDFPLLEAQAPRLYPLPASASAAVRRGRYLALAGDCAGCHTVNRDQPFAGGLRVDTPFGALYTTNITPDPDHGIGGWSFEQFYTAMHEGIAPGHKYLYPAFPFPGFTHMTKKDVRDLWTYLQTLKPIAQANHANSLKFPESFRPVMLGWRMMYFSPKTFQYDASKSAQWNRGNYMVNALGHCAACHSPRGSMGQVLRDKVLSGGVVDGWWAPNITGDKSDGLGRWSIDDIVQYLRTGSSSHTSTFGPMGVVVENSLQYLTPTDLRAMAVYLRSQSQRTAHAALEGGGKVVDAASGRAIYEDKCSSCHRFRGHGFPYAPDVPGISPPLAGNPSVTDRSARNVVMVVLHGSVEPYTIPRPLPYAMPGFADDLSDKQVAAVVNYIRNAWGNQAPGVSAEQVHGLRSTEGKAGK